MNQKRAYCLDTSTLITAFNFTYPPDSFVSLWDRLSSAMESGQIIAPIEVFEEVKKKDDDLLKWIKTRKKMFHELSDSGFRRMADIMEKFPRLIDPDKPTIQADPYVIALAAETDRIVITEEKSDSATIKKTKIPTVCNHYGILSKSLIQVIKLEEWKF